MATESARPTAHDQRENIQQKLSSIDNTFKRINELAGLPPNIVDRVHELNRKRRQLHQRLSKVWADPERAHSDADEVARGLKERLARSTNGLESKRQQLVQLQDQLKSLRAGDKGGPESSGLSREIGKLESAVQRETEALRAVEVGYNALSEGSAQAEHKLGVAKKALNSLANAPNEALDALRVEVDQLLDEGRALYEDATKERTLAAAGETVKSNAAQFDKALRHHRNQAAGILVGLVVALAVLAVAIGYVFQLWGVRTQMLPDSRLSIQPHVLLVVGGRVTLVAGAAWLVVFLGELHSRHSQQAVSYQDRLAGLDVIG